MNYRVIFSLLFILSIVKLCTNLMKSYCKKNY